MNSDGIFDLLRDLVDPGDICDPNERLAILAAQLDAAAAKVKRYKTKRVGPDRKADRSRGSTPQRAAHIDPAPTAKLRTTRYIGGN